MEKKIFTLEEEIQRTLACIDFIDRIEINPWFPTRLKEKMNQTQGPTPLFDTILGGLLKPDL